MQSLRSDTSDSIEFTLQKQETFYVYLSLRSIELQICNSNQTHRKQFQYNYRGDVPKGSTPMSPKTDFLGYDKFLILSPANLE